MGGFLSFRFMFPFVCLIKYNTKKCIYFLFFFYFIVVCLFILFLKPKWKRISIYSYTTHCCCYLFKSLTGWQYYACYQSRHIWQQTQTIYSRRLYIVAAWMAMNKWTWRRANRPLNSKCTPRVSTQLVIRKFEINVWKQTIHNLMADKEKNWINYILSIEIHEYLNHKSAYVPKQKKEFSFF